jgi:3-deoxy-7-phosphoheptulonate synthase
MTAAASALAGSWGDRQAVQQPEWPDLERLAAVLGELAGFAPLVFASECDQLRERLAAVARGEAFVLQGGDCAETFAEASPLAVRARLQTILQMAVVLTYGTSIPIIKIGRMAGQFAKPRSRATEVRDGVELPAYRGDAVNGLEFTAAARTPDPGRLLRAYHSAAVTLSLFRALTADGFADLHQVHAWNQDFVRDSPAGQRYDRLAGEIDRALAFMRACGADPDELRTVELYASHEALLLPYEQALTRRDDRTGGDYDLSAHMVWIGERTRAIDGAHVEFATGIRNPIGLKVGPTATPDELVALVRRLSPDGEPGRLTLISRLGAGQIRALLPPLVAAVQAEGAPVAWICDPMHGNTFEAPGGYKTRRFDDVVSEVQGFFDVHRRLGTHPGGIHIEFTSDNVTECVGGSYEIAADELHQRYETACDPRLNRRQALDLAFTVAESYRSLPR